MTLRIIRWQSSLLDKGLNFPENLKKQQQEGEKTKKGATIRVYREDVYKTMQGDDTPYNTQKLYE